MALTSMKIFLSILLIHDTIQDKAIFKPPSKFGGFIE